MDGDGDCVETGPVGIPASSISFVVSAVPRDFRERLEGTGGFLARSGVGEGRGEGEDGSEATVPGGGGVWVIDGVVPLGDNDRATASDGEEGEGVRFEALTT